MVNFLKARALKIKGFIKAYGFYLLIVAGIFSILGAAIAADHLQTQRLFEQAVSHQMMPYRMTASEMMQFWANHPDLRNEDLALADQMLIDRASAGLPSIFDLTEYWREIFGTPPTHRAVYVQILDWPLVWTGPKRAPQLYSLWYLTYFGTPQGEELLLWWTEYDMPSADGYGTCIRFHPDWQKYPLVCGLKLLNAEK